MVAFRMSAYLLLCALAAAAAATPLEVRLKAAALSPVVHTAPELPENVWAVSNEMVMPNTPVRMVFQVKRSNLAGLEATARMVSSPTHQQFGKHLSHEEVLRLMAPAQGDIDTVAAWLSAANVPSKLAATGDRFIVHTTVRAASSLLQTSFQVFGNPDTQQKAVRAGDYILPAAIDAAVEAVFGLHGVPLPPSRASKAAPLQLGVAKVTPAVITSTYNVSGVAVSRSIKNRQAVAEFQGQSMSNSSLSKFFQEFVPTAKPGDDMVYNFEGSPGDRGDGVEALLDIEYIMGVAPGIKTEFWYQASNDFCSDLKVWTTNMLAKKDIPNVFSVSYGIQADVSTAGCTTAEVSAVDTDFQALATRGITIIFASGDSGSAPQTRVFKKPKVVLWPSWPASSPWVTAVGATRFIDQTVGHGEQACDQFGSGGGFSGMFKAPTWQTEAVSHYFGTVDKSSLPPADSYPAQGRATPDVAALGEGYEVVVGGGGTEAVGGTSASAPAFAALVSLLNEARMQAGKPPLGFLNQFIYANAALFRDVTVGSDKHSRNGGIPLQYGFDCAAGWDPVTGFGTPSFDKLLTAVMKL